MIRMRDVLWPTALRIALLPVVLLSAAGCSVSAPRNCEAANCAADAQITAAVRDLLYKRSDVVLGDLTVQSVDGVVYLYGLVDTDVQRHAIVTLAANVNGVRRVVDSLTLRNAAR